MHGIDLAGLQARGGLFDAANLAAGTGVIAELFARSEVLYPDVRVVRLYAARAGDAPDNSGPAHATHQSQSHSGPWT